MCSSKSNRMARDYCSPLKVHFVSVVEVARRVLAMRMSAWHHKKPGGLVCYRTGNATLATHRDYAVFAAYGPSAFVDISFYSVVGPMPK